MDGDYFIGIEDIAKNYGIKLSDEQAGYVSALFKLLRNNLRDDFGLLCNMYRLFQSCKGRSFVVTEYNALTCMLSSQNKDATRISLVTFLGQQFGFAEKTIYNYLQIAGRFIDFLAGEKFVISELKDYSISKLQELLPLSDEVIRKGFDDKILTYKSTRAEIRAFVKTCKGTPAKKVVDEPLEALEQQNRDSEYNVSISIPQDVYEYIQEQVLKYKKYASLEEFVLSLIRDKMKK